MTKYTIFDNGGRTPDRYTVVDRESGNVFAVGEPPGEAVLSIKYCGNCADHRITLYSAGWRQLPLSHMIITAETDNYVRNAQLNPAWLGKEISLRDCPAILQKNMDGLKELQSPALHAVPDLPYIGPKNDENPPKTAMAL